MLLVVIVMESWSHGVMESWVPVVVSVGVVVGMAGNGDRHPPKTDDNGNHVANVGVEGRVVERGDPIQE